MLSAGALLVAFVLASAFGAISCLDENGNPVDWFVAMKVPGGQTYFYTDTNSALTKSSNTVGSGGAIALSFAQIYQRSSSQGLLAWNDEEPSGKQQSEASHAKGVLYFDS